MKKIIFALLILVTGNCFSQAREDEQNKVQRSAWLYNTAGMELKKAGTCYFVGLGGMVAGTIFISVGEAEQQAAYSTNPNTTVGAGPITLGVLMVGTGAVYGVLAWVHIIRAGKIMESTKVSFGPTQHGIGLAYKF